MSNQSQSVADPNKPLEDLDHWEDFLKTRYPNPGSDTGADGARSAKEKSEFRDYRKEARPSVKEFYRLNHTHQTYDFVQGKRKEFLSLKRREMSVWEAL